MWGVRLADLAGKGLFPAICALQKGEPWAISDLDFPSLVTRMGQPHKPFSAFFCSVIEPPPLSSESSANPGRGRHLSVQ